MKGTLKRVASKLPPRWRQHLKRNYFSWQIRAGRFASPEPEYPLLDRLVARDSWVLDIGANVGHYTLRFSRLVGPRGRVIAFEPVIDTFELLAANVSHIRAHNVTLVNAAASESTTIGEMRMPKFDSGLDNYYMTQLVKSDGQFSVMCLPIDAIRFPQRIHLVKIDAEGHELSVVKGMEALLRRDYPILIIEDNVREIDAYLAALGYRSCRLPGSSNQIFMTSITYERIVVGCQKQLA